MEFISGKEIQGLVNPGVVSRQLLNPENSQSQRVTLTEVHLEPGACQPRHSHQTSEQVWYALAGQGTLLLGEGKALPFCRGDVVRFVQGEIHGLKNDAPGEFVYLAVTTPPLNFRGAYQETKESPAPYDSQG